MSVLKKIFQFYYQGFRNMPKWGKQLWAIILFKGIVIFILIRFIFFPNYLNKNFETDEERGEHVMEQLINKKSENDTTKH
jgi:hypothetical protein